MLKSKITYESKIEKAKEKIKEKPNNALKEIGKLIAAELRKITPVETGYMKKSIGYWFRKKEGDLQIGFKAFYSSNVILGDRDNKGNDFFTPLILDKKNDIQNLIQQALRELEKEK